MGLPWSILFYLIFSYFSGVLFTSLYLLHQGIGMKYKSLPWLRLVNEWYLSKLFRNSVLCSGPAPSPDGNSYYSYSSYSLNSCPHLSSIDHDEGPLASSSSTWNIAVMFPDDQLQTNTREMSQQTHSVRPLPYHMHRFTLNANLAETQNQHYPRPTSHGAAIQNRTDLRPQYVTSEIRPSSTLNSAVEMGESQKNLENTQEHAHCQQEYSSGRHNKKGLDCDFLLGDLFEKHPGVQADLLRILEDERAADNKFLRRQASPGFSQQLKRVICCEAT